MEPRLGKRQRSAQSKVIRKRQKLEKPDRLSNPHTAAGRTKKLAQGKAVTVDNLAWKEVELPDQLEDAEGFLGLEEIDDVEVFRDNGVIQFRVGRLRSKTGNNIFANAHSIG